MVNVIIFAIYQLDGPSIDISVALSSKHQRRQLHHSIDLSNRGSCQVPTIRRKRRIKLSTLTLTAVNTKIRESSLRLDSIWILSKDFKTQNVAKYYDIII